MQVSVNYTLDVQPAADFTLSLVGGWRLNQPYCKAGLAIDFATMRCWTLGHAQTVNLAGYDLPAMSVGTNVANWVQVNQARNYGSPYSVSGWNATYGQQLYAGGLMWHDDKLWMSGRGFYSSGGSYPNTVIKKYNLSGSTATLAETLISNGREMQSFGGGFIKGHPTEILVGNGGYESGQGGRCGPCWMKLDGTVLNTFPSFDAPKDQREKRSNNYSCPASQWFVPPDGQVGYWFAGRIWGGGLYVRGKTCFWVDQGTGACNYTNQTDTFGNSSQVYLYKYGTDHFGTYSIGPNRPVIGSEISPDGTKVYLLLREAWVLGGYDPCPAIACYNVV